MKMKQDIKGLTLAYAFVLAFAITFVGVSNVFMSAFALDSFEVSPVPSALEITQQSEPQYGTEEQLSKVNSEVVKFIKEIALMANESGLKHDVYPSITIAQGILESGYGKSSLSATHNNLFGIKGSYKGNSVKVKTWEDDGSGQTYTTKANFRVYPSWAESIQDHDDLLKNGLDGFYSGAWVSQTESYKEAAQYLQGRYATDTNYAKKLIGLIEDYNLTRFDKVLTHADTVWLASDSLDPFEVPHVEVTETQELTWGSASVVRPKGFMKPVRQGQTIAVEYLDDNMNTKLELLTYEGTDGNGNTLVSEVHNGTKLYRILSDKN